MRAYLDNAATTPLDARVLNKMKPYFNLEYGNPSSIHQLGQESFIAISRARENIAKIIGGKSESIVFTSGASESNNFIIKGVVLANSGKRNKIITSNIEHPCVREAAKELARNGFVFEEVSVNEDGIVTPEALEKVLDDKTILVSIMTVNNEIGTVNDIAKLSEITHRFGAYFHTDAVQAVPYLKLNIEKMGIDLLSLSAHKFYGPKGVGLAYVKKGIKIKPLIHGGEQENGLRAGTYNVPGIVGLEAALELAYKERTVYLKKVKSLRDYLWKRIKTEIKDVHLNGSMKNRVPANLNIMFSSIEGEAILMDMSHKGVYVSTGSACSASNLHSSYVLKAIGLNDNKLNSNIRFSLGRQTTKKEIDYTVKCLKDTVARLRKFSPIK